MRWQGRRTSRNVEDRRGRSALGRPVLVGGGGLLLLVVVAGVLFGVDPTEFLQFLSADTSPTGYPAPSTDAPTGQPLADEPARFVSVVLADTEDTWTPIFRQSGHRYDPPILVLFTEAVESACGFGSAAAGPFYCPGDRKLYIDLGFYRELQDRFGAPGDFAQAYVIAHEVGHHVQNLLGISDEVHRLQEGLGRAEANALSVRLELQADCLAGVWGYHADLERQLLEAGDVEEGLRAAAAIGDDRIQRMSGARVHPESWTHGSSAQRVEWFRRGLRSGDPDTCDTFSDGGL